MATTPVTFDLVDISNDKFYSRIFIAPMTYPLVYSGSIVVGDVINIATTERNPTKTISLVPNDYKIRCIGTPHYETQFYISVVDTSGVAVSASSIVNSGPITTSNFTASYAITASYALNGGGGGGGGATSSWASSSITSSWSTTASYAVSALTASYAQTSSWATNAITSSWATTASYAVSALTASYAQTSSWATNAITASWATTASHAIVAGSLVTSSNYKVNILTASLVSSSTFVGQQVTASYPHVYTTYSIGNPASGSAIETFSPSSLLESLSDYSFKVAAYQTTPSGRIYSSTPLIITVTDADNGEYFSWAVSWAPVASATGYRVLFTDPHYPSSFDYYRDTTLTFLNYDGDAVTAGSTITPLGPEYATTQNTALGVSGNIQLTGSILGTETASFAVGLFPSMLQMPYSSSGHTVLTGSFTGSSYYKVSDNRMYVYNGSRWMSSSLFG